MARADLPKDRDPTAAELDAAAFEEAKEITNPPSPYQIGFQRSLLPPPKGGSIRCPFANNTPDARRWWDGFGDGTQAMIDDQIADLEE